VSSGKHLNNLTRRFSDGSQHFLFNFHDRSSSWYCRNSSLLDCRRYLRGERYLASVPELLVSSVSSVSTANTELGRRAHRPGFDAQLLSPTVDQTRRFAALSREMIG